MSNKITDEKLLELTGELYDIAFAAGRDEEPNYKRVNEIDAELKDLITSQKAIWEKEARIDELGAALSIFDLPQHKQIVAYHQAKDRLAELIAQLSREDVKEL